MRTSMQLQIITPERVFYSGQATQVTAPGVMGEFGVLPGHAPFISTLKAGIIRVQSATGTERIAMLEGVAEVTPDHCTILAEQAVSLENLTAEEIQAELQAARDAAETAHTDEIKARTTTRLQLAEIIAKAH